MFSTDRYYSMGIFSDIAGPITNRRSSRVAYSRQVRMYKNRYQWQMEDMRKAGLNPILNSMSGAPTAGAPGMQRDTFGGLDKTVSNVLAAKRQETELAEIKSREELNALLGRKAVEDAGHSAASATNQRTEAFLKSLQIPAAMNAMSIEQQYGPPKQKIEWLMNNLGKIVPGLFFGLGRRGGKKAQGGRPPRAGVRHSKKPAPYVGPRNTPDGSRPWRSAAPQRKK